ncbi:HET-domain-containing protein [Rhizodiscina lignyota]|uniref:HET-domain-containing protein n=1 Tax=Rhizodiscina lignyota TaxID=1504668 RepID=A0A9P4IJH8_9PEZI|nr:HET-domain-containing protein [Rhizodiscina lignyota]
MICADDDHIGVVVDPHRDLHHRKVVGTIARKFKPDATSIAPTSTAFTSEDKFNCGGREVQPEADINLIKDWLRFCNTWHHECRQPIYEVAGKPKFRLIDVQEQRVVWAASGQDYVTLSYVWGQSTMPLLTRDVVSKYSSINGLKACNMPRTISDAIHLVKLLGERYLWVDTLCIVQDDDEDKEDQLPLMGYIYSHAIFLIVAAAGSDAHAGLPGLQGTKRNISQRIETIDGAQFITAQPELKHMLENSVWNIRGWTFQEMVLSRRSIIFTEAQISWICQAESWREGIKTESSVFMRVRDRDNSPLTPFVRTSESENWSSVSPCRTSVYCQQAQLFSGRNFKVESDVIWAFMGILHFLTSLFPGGFIWGIPYESIDAALLWSEDTFCHNVHSRYAQHTMLRKGSLYGLPYPSWSWLSSKISVKFMDLCGDTIHSEVTWHEPFKLGDEASEEFLKSVYPLADSTNDKHWQELVVRPIETSETQAIDYGLLHFTALTAKLTLRPSQPTTHVLGSNDSLPLGADTPWATIYASNGDSIGETMAPLILFNEDSERVGEFVLLSSTVVDEADEACRETAAGLDHGKIIHVHGCSHIESRNVMLIEWSGQIAYRRGLSSVRKEDWAKVETQQKTIILG